MALNFYRLEAFCVVVDQQSISRAAESLSVTQPVMSRLISEVERHYGTSLLLRNGRRVLPTEAGLVVYRYAREVLRATRDTEHTVSELVDGGRGLLSIGITTAIGSYTFPELWRQFSVNYPGMQLALHLMHSQRVFEETRDGSLDLGLALTAAVPQGVITETLGRVELVLVAAANHPLAGRAVTREEVAGQTFLCTNGASSYENLAQALNAWGLGGECPILQMGDTETVKQAAEVGLGLARLARVAITRELAAGTLASVQLAGQPPGRDLLLVQPQRSTRSGGVHTFVQFLRERAAVLFGKTEQTESYR